MKFSWPLALVFSWLFLLSYHFCLYQDWEVAAAFLRGFGWGALGVLIAIGVKDLR